MALFSNLKLTPFLADSRGNLTLTTAIMSLVIVGAAALAIDTNRLTQAKSILRDANDTATLAAAREFRKSQTEREQIYANALKATLINSNAVEDYGFKISFTETEGSVQLNSDAWAYTNYLFPNFFGAEASKVTASSEAITGKIRLEVALILDVSGADIGEKIDEIKASATRFVEIILKDSYYRDNASISIIPFTGTVKLPEEMKDFLQPPTTNKHWVNQEWNGCVSLEPDHFKNGLLPQNKYPYMADFRAWGRTNTGWCPRGESSLLELTNNYDELVNHIDNLGTGYGSASDHGMAWGFATLDPRWQSKFPNKNKRSPLNFDNRYKKAIVFMGNSHVNVQFRPTPAELEQAPPVHTRNYLYNEATAQRAFFDMCDLSKENDIEIFTVGFDVRRAEVKRELTECATTTTHYHDAKRNRLEETFEDIAAYLSSLRLTQ